MSRAWLYGQVVWLQKPVQNAVLLRAGCLNTLSLGLPILSVKPEWYYFISRHWVDYMKIMQKTLGKKYTYRKAK